MEYIVLISYSFDPEKKAWGPFQDRDDAVKYREKKISEEVVTVM